MKVIWTALPSFLGSALVLAACSAESGSVGAISSSTVAGGGGAPGTGQNPGAGGTSSSGRAGSSGAGGNGASLGGSPGAGGFGASVSSGGTSGAGASAAGGSASGSPSQGGSAGASGSAATGGNGGAAAGNSANGGSPPACVFPPLPCSDAEIAAAKVIALTQPIIPPRFVAGVDLLGPSGKGIPFEEVDAGFRRPNYATPAIVYPGECMRLCQSAVAATPEVDFQLFLTGSGLVTITNGYTGEMTMMSRPGGPWGTHTYVVAIGKKMTRDGVPVTLSWDSPAKTDPKGIFDELYDAAIYTFAPYLAPRAGTHACFLSGDCQLGALGDNPYWTFPAIGVTAQMGSTSVSPDAASVPATIQIVPVRDLGFSRSTVKLGLGAGLPLATASALGPSAANCNLSLGSKLGDVLGSCVRVTGSALGDGHEMEKLFAGLERDSEMYRTNTPGIALGIHADTLGPFDVIAADQQPADSDVIREISFDQSVGLTSPADVIANDHIGSDPAAPIDRHGIGLVYLEYARLVQKTFQDARTDSCPDAASCPPGQAPRRTLGDPACLKPNVTVDATGAPVFPQGCSGFEGFVTTAPVPAQVPPDEPYLAALSVPSLNGPLAGFNPGLQPGSPLGAFCVALANQSASECSAALGGVIGPLFSASHDRVLAAAKGANAALPPELRDSFYFARLYATALARYLLAAGSGNETADAVHAVKVQPSDILVGPADGSGVSDFRYVAHDLATPGDRPPTFGARIDFANGVVPSYSFTSYLERSETAAYTLTASSGVALGSAGDDASLTSLFGSSLLDSVWGNEPPGCATGAATGCAVGPPLDSTGAIALDDRGDPLLTRYASTIGHPTPVAISHVGISIDGPGYPFAKVLFPAGLSPGFETLLPGTAASAFDPAFLSFTGVTMDVELTYLAGTPTVFTGLRANRYEGRVFLCFDPISKTLLSAANNEPADPMLDWLKSHIAAANACQLSSDLGGRIIKSAKYGVAVLWGQDFSAANRVWQTTLWDPMP